MDEFDHPDDLPAEPKPLTADEANRVATLLKQEAHARGSALVLLAEAYRDATNRCAILEAENHDLRLLVDIRDVEATRALLSEILRGTATIRQAVQALEEAAPPSRKMMMQL